MIPKVIHYCWFGEGEKNKLVKKCINSWKKYCPDYQIKEWNESNFDINLNAYTKYCYENQKWAFLRIFNDKTAVLGEILTEINDKMAVLGIICGILFTFVE